MSNLLTTTQAAERLGITPNRLRVLIRQGRLPAVRFGRDWQIQASDLALVADRKWYAEIWMQDGKIAKVK